MDMSTGSTAVPMWYAELPITDSRCANDSCIAFKRAHTASQARVSWESQFHYGWYVSWLYAVTLALFSGINLLHRALDKLSRVRGTTTQRQGPNRTPGMLDKTTAAIRFITYRRLSGRVGASLALPSVGVLSLIMAAVVATTAMVFSQGYYYRERRSFGSPAIAIRTGLMSAALIPLLIALSGKVNLVTLITGYGHEKLNVWHRTTGWLMFVLSVVHTVPYLYQESKEGILHKQWSKPGSLEYSGTPALAVGFFLAVFSIPYCRSLVYELFRFSHVAAAICFLGLCFWHFNQEGDSWNYLWATLAIWLVQILGRTFWKTSALRLRDEWFEGFPAFATALKGGEMIKLSVFVPKTYTWKPGNHVFLRFPSLAILDHHPFTIASIPEEERLSHQDRGSVESYNTLSFLIRAHKGFTRRILSKVSSTADFQLSVIVDGPYGTVMRPLEHLYEDVILLAGGGGITAIVPWALHLARRLKVGCVTRRVHVVWIVKHASAVEWVATELREALNTAPTGSVSVQVYVTQDTHIRPKITPSQKMIETGQVALVDIETEVDHSGTAITQHCDGRPQLSCLMPTLLGSKRTAVVGCGPESLKIDLSNSIAAAQSRVFKGEAVEIMLHTETFDW